MLILFLVIANGFWLWALLTVEDPETIFSICYIIIRLLIVAVFVYKRRAHEAGWKMQEIVDGHNTKLREVGLRWRVPPNFPSWIELHKDYKKHQTGYVVASAVVTGNDQTQENRNYNPPQYQMP